MRAPVDDQTSTSLGAGVGSHGQGPGPCPGGGGGAGVGDVAEIGADPDLLERSSSQRSLKVEDVEVQPPNTYMEPRWEGGINHGSHVISCDVSA